jgi:hypothetical protein
MSGIPPMSHEMAAVYARQDTACAFIRAWVANDVDKGMLLIEHDDLSQGRARLMAR